MGVSYGWPFIAKLNKVRNCINYIQQFMFTFNKLHSHSTTNVYVQKHAFAFNFNPGIVHSTIILIQL